MKFFGDLALLISCLLLSPLAPRSDAATWETISRTRTLRAASEGAYPPFNVFKDGRLAGFEIDLVEKLASSMKLSVEWKSGSFDTLLIGLSPQQDRFDLVAASHTITPERSKVVEFTRPTYCSQIVIITKKGGPLTLKDLSGKSASIQVGTTGVPLLTSKIGSSALKTFPTDPEAMQALLMGRVDAWISEVPLLAEARKSHPELIQGEPLTRLEIGIAVAKGNIELRDRLNAALAAAQRDGSYDVIRKRYIDHDISCR